MKLILTRPEYNRVLAGLLNAALWEDSLEDACPIPSPERRAANKAATEYRRLRRKLLMADPKAPEPIRCALP